jgi:hypothetical protein
VFVAVEDGQAVDVANRDDGFTEVPRPPRGAGALLALHRIGIHLVARKAVLGGYEVGRHPLRQIIALECDRGIDWPSPARGADPDAAHRLDAAAHRHVVLARHDLRGGEIDRIEPRGAEAVDLDARHRLVVARIEHRGARNVAAGLADGIDAAHHHVVELARVELVALAHRHEHLGREFERGDRMQRAVGLAAPARRAHVVVDVAVRHVVISQPASSV